MSGTANVDQPGELLRDDSISCQTEMGKWVVLPSLSAEQQPLLSIKGQKPCLHWRTWDSWWWMTLWSATTAHVSHPQYHWTYWQRCGNGRCCAKCSVKNDADAAQSSKAIALAIQPSDVTTSTWHVIWSASSWSPEFGHDMWELWNSEKSSTSACKFASYHSYDFAIKLQMFWYVVQLAALLALMVRCTVWHEVNWL